MADGSGEASGKWWYPFRFLGQIAGALSILNLIRDLNWFSLKGIAATWVAAYGHLVKEVFGFLFGWIHISWMQVSSAEAHLLLITSLLMSSILRSYRDTWVFPALDSKVLDTILACVTAWCLAALVALLLPGVWGVGGLVLFVPVILVLVWAADQKEERKALATNLGVSFGLVATVVIASAIVSR